MVNAEGTRNLVLANAVTVALALILHWPLNTLLWPFWVQSVIIGWYSRRRILSLTNFSTDGFTMNHQPVPPTPESLRFVARFFTFHYGFFHFGYLAFLVKRTPAFAWWDWLGLIAAAASFVMSHRASFRQNLEADKRGRPNLGTLMFLPYARIIPMHAMILVGAGYVSDSVVALLLFAALKTGADVLMHHVEHSLLQRGAMPLVSVSARDG
jgi:Family of unknown function (DUF6498)